MKLFKKVLTWIVLGFSSLVVLWMTFSVWTTVYYEFYWNQIIDEGYYTFAVKLVIVGILATLSQLYILKVAFQKKEKYLLSLLLLIPLFLLLSMLLSDAGFNHCDGIGCSLPR